MASKKRKTVEELIALEQEMYREHGYQKEIILAFPDYQKLPFFARFAIRLIRYYGGTFRIVFHDKR